MVFTGDHGRCWGDHGRLRKSVPYSSTRPARLFREYYDLRADPCRLTDRLHGASAEEERRLGIPRLVRGPAAARKA